MPPSLLEPTPPSLARQFYRCQATAHRVGCRRALRLFLVAAVFALAWTGWYLAKRGFGKEWRERVVEELHKRGVEASVRRLTLDPVRGLIAQDVRIFDFKNRDNTLAVISEVALDINYAALLHHQPFLNALDVRAEELQRFSFPGEAPTLQVKFSGDLSQFEAAHAEVTLRGERLLRGAYEMKNLSMTGEWVNQTLNINQCEWQDNAGKFSGRANWSRETNAAAFQARSTLDAKKFLDAFGFGQFVADLALTSPPPPDLSGSVTL